MIALVAAVLFVVAVAAGHPMTKPLQDVDPNRLSCDPTGQTFLLLPHTESCNKFFMCDNGEEKEFVCPSPLIFDFELQTCNWEYDTKCILRSETDVEGSGDWDEGTDEFVGNSNAGVNTPIKVVADFKVPLDCRDPKHADTRIPHKDDCQRYWRCSEGKVHAFYCMDGLFFNDKTQQCDFEANVVCNVNHEYELQDEFMVYKS